MININHEEFIKQENRLDFAYNEFEVDRKCYSSNKERENQEYEIEH